MTVPLSVQIQVVSEPEINAKITVTPPGITFTTPGKFVAVVGQTYTIKAEDVTGNYVFSLRA